MPSPPRAEEAPSDDFEHRLVVFTDGASPRIVSTGDREVRGPLELEVRFRSVNPLCFEYETNISASRVAANDRSLPASVPGMGALGAPSSRTFAAVEEALSQINAAETDIDEVLNAARIQVSLDDVWSGCDGGADFAVQRARVDSAARMASERLGPDGAWRQSLENAEAVALGGKRLARELEAGQRNGTLEVETRRAELAAAERAEREAREAIAKGARTPRTQLEDTARELASAQRKLREAELNLGRRHDLGRAADHLAERVQGALKRLGAAVGEINRARSLLARSPTAIRRRFDSGERVTVAVRRTRLERGERIPGRGPQVFEIAAYRTLRPVILDLGIGPGLGIGRNDSKYETVWSPKGPEDKYSAWRVVRTDQGLPVDVLVTLSVYLWNRRYFDDVVFDASYLLPRPMVGISLSNPLHQLYAGVSIDPIQFLDISGGVRIADEQVLLGPQVGDRALIDTAGNPQPPVTRNEFRASGFVAVTVSTNLLYNWIRQGL
jgi:hypothetical protein